MTRPLIAHANQIACGAPNPVRSTLVLAKCEAKLLCRHPAYLVGLAIMVYVLYQRHGDWADERGLFSGPSLIVTACLGVPAYFAANRRASQARRSGTEELVTACPMPPPRRTLALCLATAAPFAVAAVIVFYLDFYIASHHLRYEEPGTMRLLASACTVLGASLLGIMINRWLPWPGTALVVMVGVIAVTMRLENGTNQLLGPYPDWALWAPYSNTDWYGVLPGSPGWHLVYLISLSVMAALGALFAHREWRRAVLVVAVPVAVFAAVAAVAQLP